MGRVTHYRRLPDAFFNERKVMPGVRAQPFRDFVPQSGTLLFLDYQSNATIGVNILPNFDGDAYPHTVLEMALSNPRPLTDIEQLESVTPHDTDIATLAYVEEMVLNPEKFVPETTDIVPNIDPDRMLASLRVRCSLLLPYLIN